MCDGIVLFNCNLIMLEATFSITRTANYHCLHYTLGNSTAVSRGIFLSSFIFVAAEYFLLSAFDYPWITLCYSMGNPFNTLKGISLAS